MPDRLRTAQMRRLAIVVSIVLLTSGCSLFAYGSNTNGQLGLGDTVDRADPAGVPGTEWEIVSAGDEHTCGVRDGELYCWGSDEHGQLGLGIASAADQSGPVRVGTESDWTYVGAGDDNTCGLRADQTAWCWGNNSYGELGDGTTVASEVPNEVIGGHSWQQLSTGGTEVCGIRTDQQLWCWGGLDWPRPSTPEQAGYFAWEWTHVSAGGEHVCGIRTNASLYCWGYNFHDQFGPISLYGDPAKIGGNEWAEVFAGHGRTCAIKLDGTLWCWGGYNVQASCCAPIGYFEQTAEPFQVGAGKIWVQVDPGFTQTCGVASEPTRRSLWCWDGPDSLIEVEGATRWYEVSVGRFHTVVTSID